MRRVKVAIIGGGCAAVAAAFELTRPEHEGRYDVTLYQLGWRLGGKGASGRGPAGRIEEHGLHVWMGWYENAFRLIRECYAELGRDRGTCPITDWRDAFSPAPLLGVAERAGDGGWAAWTATLPPTEGLPGDPPTNRRLGVSDYMARSVVLLRSLFETLQRGGGVAPAAHGTPAPGAVTSAVTEFLRYGELATLAGLVQATALLEAAIGALDRAAENLVLRFIDAIATNARELLEARLASDPPARRAWHVIDLTLATLRGAIRAGLATDPRGFDAIDEYDCREWLLLNGASEAAVNSGWMRSLYDLVFAYEDGDPARPRMSAGQALRGMVRTFFTYRGAFFWKMQAGMGDVVFAPIYEVLRRRGVRFAFFHRLENVRLATGESRYVEALELDVQADVVGAREYEPLVEVGGLPCWPSAPDWRQLVDGARLAREGWDFESHWDHRKARTRTLRVIDHFDLVVLGVGLGAIPHVARELVATDPHWRAMIDYVKTVPTQAVQIWLGADLRDLGWAHGPVTLSGFVEPFDTWADMGHLLAREGWPLPPRALAYFCSVLPPLDVPDDRSNPAYLPVAREEVRRNAVHFLKHDIAHLWPGAVRAPGEFRWELLVDPREALGEARFASQYWAANVNPSDRYALSLPGSSAYRISPLDRAYDNLTIAGDWTACGFNAGCVEAAVMSGRLAAHAIAGSPPLADIVGYDHP